MNGLRRSALAICLAAAAWAAGCATPGPMIDPAFAARAYTPLRIAVLQPDVFVVLDQVGDNDPVASAALGQAVTGQTVQAINQALRSRGYDVDLSARWDGIVAPDGSLLVNRDEMGWLANGILQFANSPEGGGAGPMTQPAFIAPEVAAHVGWATQSDALLYVNVKGVSVSSGKRAAEVLAAVFIVVIIAAIILAIAASGKNNNGSSSGLGRGAGMRGQPVMRGTPPATGGARLPSTSGFRGTPPGAGGPIVAPRGRGYAPPIGGGPRRVYGGGGPHVGIGVGVIIPLDGPVYTHDGTVSHEDDTFAGDQLYVSMTLVSAQDGRVLWHQRQSLDLDAQSPADLDRMVH
ncbi:MAG TPA: hypothetical protein VFH68_14350, partial [Polyangia bacterium]|nr:hypothetical protein [Polyangia bacterium]